MVFWLFAARRLDSAADRFRSSVVASAFARTAPFLTVSPTATLTSLTDHVPDPLPPVLLASMAAGAAPKSRP